MDALLLTRKAQSLADLSLSIAFRRQWSSVYEALQDTRARSRTINEALHRTNPSIRTNCARRRLARVGVDRLPKLSRNVLTNIPHCKWEVVRWPWGTATVPWRGYPKPKGVGQCHFCTRELPVGTALSLWQFGNYPG